MLWNTVTLWIIAGFLLGLGWPWSLRYYKPRDDDGHVRMLEDPRETRWWRRFAGAHLAWITPPLIYVALWSRENTALGPMPNNPSEYIVYHPITLGILLYLPGLALGFHLFICIVSVRMTWRYLPIHKKKPDC